MMLVVLVLLILFKCPLMLYILMRRIIVSHMYNMDEVTTNTTKSCLITIYLRLMNILRWRYIYQSLMHILVRPINSITPYLFRSTINTVVCLFRPSISTTPQLFRPIISTYYFFRPNSIPTNLRVNPLSLHLDASLAILLGLEFKTSVIPQYKYLPHLFYHYQSHLYFSLYLYRLSHLLS